MKNGFPHSVVKRIRNGIFPADYLVFCYSAYLIIFCSVFYRQAVSPGLFISFNLIVIAVLLTVIYNDKRDSGSVMYWAHTWIPIVSFLFYYLESTILDNVIFPETFDPILYRWDFAVFGVALNRVLGPAAGNLFLDEIMHMLYFSYYLLLFVPAIIMLAKKWHRFHEMVFSLTFMMYFHFLFFMFFPGDGPLGDRILLFQDGVVFIPLMDLIYRFAENGGGAFPSTHVSAVVIIFFYSLKFFEKSYWIVGFFCVGMVVATVYCSYHYAIDSVAGVMTGVIFYFIGRWVYLKFPNSKTEMSVS